MMEGWFFQAIQHKTSTETGIEQGVQGTIEGVVSFLHKIISHKKRSRPSYAVFGGHLML